MKTRTTSHGATVGDRRSERGFDRPGVRLLLAALCLSIVSGAANANIRENQDPPGADQNTTSITLHPDPQGGPDLLISAYNSNPFAFGGIGTSRSPDGGATWFDSALPPAPVFTVNLDASVASDGAAVVFAGFSSYDALPPLNTASGVFVCTSFDGGLTFGAPVGVNVQAGPMGLLPWETKPKVDADGYLAAGSPYAGNAYMIWESDLQITGWVNGPSDAVFAFSVDQGMTWSPPLAVNDNPGNDLVLWPDVDVGSDGSIVAGWVDSPYWLQHQGTLVMDRSTDGGVTFGQDVPAVSFWCVPQLMTDQAGGGQTRFAQSYASVAVDPSNPQRIGVAFAADPDDGPACEARVDTGDMTSGFDAHLLNPFAGASNLSYSGSHLHAVWTEARPGVTDVYYNRAPLGSFPPAWDNPDQMISTQSWMDHPSSNNANIVSNFSSVYAAWDEWIGVDFSHLIYVNVSNDDGTTWYPQAIPLDTHYRACYEPWITVDGMDHACVAWLEDQADGIDTDLYVSYTTDAGGTWASPEIQVPTTYRAFDHDIDSFHDYVAGLHYVYLVWAEATVSGTGSVVMFSMSATSGATWSTPVRLDSAPAGQELAYAPKVCCDWGNVYVCWQDLRSGTDDIYSNWSNTSGIGGWAGEVQIDNPVSRDYMSQIDCDQGNVYVVYESDVNAPGGNEDIYFNYSIGGGGNWQGPRRVDTGDPAGASHSSAPRITVGGGDGQPTPYVVWMDDRFGPAPMSGWDAFGNHSSDGGATWPPDYRIDVGTQPGTSDTWYPHIAGPVACYLYRDLRSGVGDVYGNLLFYGPDEGDIFYTESNDGGATWLNPPLRVNDDAGPADQSHCWVDIKPNGTVDVVWYDNRGDVLDRNTETFFAALLPGNGAFTPNMPVSNQPIAAPGAGFWIGDYIGVAVDETMAHVAWADNRREFNLYDAWYAAIENPQLAEVGACCLPSGACLTMTASACGQLGGDYKGDLVPCDPDPCATGFRDEDGNLLPEYGACVIRANYPNPFNPSTLIRYELGRDAPVRLTVVDIAGRVVRELLNAPLQVAGRYDVRWDGRDAAGHQVAAGVYFCRLLAGRESATLRMALIK